MRKQLPIRKPHRLPSSVYAATGYEFSFTVCARHHRAPFHTKALATEVIRSLLWTKQQYNWLLYCYCLMPDHLHFVCRLTEHQLKMINAGARGEQVESVLDHLARFKSYTTNESWRHGFKGRLWQKSSYDRVLDMEHPFVEVVEYTLNNPVRKGLVDDWEDWPYGRIVDPWWA